MPLVPTQRFQQDRGVVVCNWMGFCGGNGISFLFLFFCFSGFFKPIQIKGEKVSESPPNYHLAAGEICEKYNLLEKR